MVGQLLNMYHNINPPFLQSATDFKTEKDGDAAKDVNGDSGGGFEVCMVRAYVMGNDSIVAGGFIFGAVVALQKIMIECNGLFILILGVHGLMGACGPGDRCLRAWGPRA